MCENYRHAGPVPASTGQRFQMLETMARWTPEQVRGDGKSFAEVSRKSGVTVGRSWCPTKLKVDPA